MIKVNDLFQDKVRNFGVSPGTSKFVSDFLMSFNMVVNDLTTDLNQSLPTASSTDEEVAINAQHYNTFWEGIDHYLTSSFEWTRQTKRDSFAYYQRALKNSHSAALQETTTYGRLGGMVSLYPLMLYCFFDYSPWSGTGSPEDGPIEPIS